MICRMDAGWTWYYSAIWSTQGGMIMMGLEVRETQGVQALQTEFPVLQCLSRVEVDALVAVTGRRGSKRC